MLTDPDRYNRKPTGIIAVDGDGDGRDELYLAVQDLRKPADEGQPPHPAFDDAPAATIIRSVDRGRTWQWPAEPMFRDYVFTTIFFLDFGRSNARASVLGPDGADFVYAYGLDHNWRDSCSDAVPDPVDLWLARVPVGAIQDRDRWEFFAGLDGDEPTWSTETERRVAVLHDERRVYPGTVTEDGMSVISQGGVVYNPGLDRYLYFSWTEYTWEFYEAPRPWGPWKLFLHKEFGPYPWWGTDPGTPGPKNGGYGTVAPSKFISDDGRTLWLQANWFVGVGHPPNTYHYALRRLELTPYAATTPDNPADPMINLARTEGTVVIDRVSQHGRPWVINDGATDGGGGQPGRVAQGHRPVGVRVAAGPSVRPDRLHHRGDLGRRRLVRRAAADPDPAGRRVGRTRRRHDRTGLSGLTRPWLPGAPTPSASRQPRAMGCG